MMNVEKQVEYWRRMAPDDWEVGARLLKEKWTRQGIFFVHLAVEKALKAHVCRAIQDIAPHTHDLVRLARLSGIGFSEEQLRVLREVTSYNRQGRYPDDLLPPPPHAEAVQCTRQAEEIFEWLMKQL